MTLLRGDSAASGQADLVCSEGPVLFTEPGDKDKVNL